MIRTVMCQSSMDLMYKVGQDKWNMSKLLKTESITQKAAQ